MKSEKWTGVRAASVAGVWVAILFIICGARAQESKEKVTINDVDRAYVVRLPRGYDQERKYPVVILLHGMNQDGDDMARLTRFNELADKDSLKERGDGVVLAMAEREAQGEFTGAV